MGALNKPEREFVDFEMKHTVNITSAQWDIDPPRLRDDGRTGFLSLKFADDVSGDYNL